MSWKVKELINPHVDIKAQGRLLVVRAVGCEMEFPPPGGRGIVDTFSKSSRMRLLRLLAKTSPPKKNGFRSTVSFLTLTSRAFFHPVEAKRHLRSFLKRLYRRFCNVAVIWRMEYQERGAPHFHLIIYNCPYIKKEWIQKQWGEVIEQDRPFTRIESIRSYKHLINYASKYAAKVDDGGFNKGAYLAEGKNVSTYQNETPGRVWGVWHPGQLPMQEEVEVSIPLDGSWWMVRRYLSKFYPWIEENSEFGFTVFSDDPYHALKHIVSMSKVFVNEAVH